MHVFLILIIISKPTSGSTAKRLTSLNYFFKFVFFHLLCSVPANIYKKYKNHYKGILLFLQTDGKSSNVGSIGGKTV